MGGAGGAAGGAGGEAGAGGEGGVGGEGGAPKTCEVNSAAVSHTFEAETDAEPWITFTDGSYVPGPKPATSALQHFGAGTKSLELSVNRADDPLVTPGNPAAGRNGWYFMLQGVDKWSPYIQTGRVISAQVFVPVGHKLSSFQLGVFPGVWYYSDLLPQITPGQWSAVSFTIPPNYSCAASYQEFSIAFDLQLPAGEAWAGKIYVDDFKISAAQ